MLILALDTATETCGVAVAEGERVLVEYSERVGRNHSSRLFPLIETALKAAGREASDLEGIAVTIGPGSYTGLRIALSSASTLSYALDIPVIGLTTLEVLAFAAGPREGLISPLIDARGGRVYAALYRKDGKQPVTVLEPGVTGIKEWVTGLAGREVAFTGPGVSVYAEEISAGLGEGCLPAISMEGFIRPAAVAVLGYRRLSSGYDADPAKVVPLYLPGESASGGWHG